PFLKTPTQTYSNVTVLSLTTTDVNFTHAQGIANAKLKDLEPELQKRFSYNPTKAGEAATKQAAASAEYARQAAAQKATPKTAKAESPAAEAPDVEIRVESISAKSIK